MFRVNDLGQVYLQMLLQADSGVLVTYNPAAIDMTFPLMTFHALDHSCSGTHYLCMNGFTHMCSVLWTRPKHLIVYVPRDGVYQVCIVFGIAVMTVLLNCIR